MDLDFYARSAEENVYLKVPLRLNLAGGYCKRQFGTQIGVLFGRLGLPRVFDWGRDYWY